MTDDDEPGSKSLPVETTEGACAFVGGAQSEIYFRYIYWRQVACNSTRFYQRDGHPAPSEFAPAGLFLWVARRAHLRQNVLLSCELSPGRPAVRGFLFSRLLTT
jgi:hypothetical protein